MSRRLTADQEKSLDAMIEKLERLPDASAWLMERLLTVRSELPLGDPRRKRIASLFRIWCDRRRARRLWVEGNRREAEQLLRRAAVTAEGNGRGWRSVGDPAVDEAALARLTEVIAFCDSLPLEATDTMVSEVLDRRPGSAFPKSSAPIESESMSIKPSDWRPR